MCAVGIEVKMIVLVLTPEQHSNIAENIHRLFRTGRQPTAKVWYFKGRRNQSSLFIGSLTRRRPCCAFRVVENRLLPLDPPLMMNYERCWFLGGGRVALVFLRMLGEGGLI